MHKNHVLVVSGTSGLRQRLVRLLTGCGWWASEAVDLAGVLKELCTGQYGCAIVDGDAGKVPTTEVVAALKAAEPKLGVIVTTSRNTPELEAAMRQQEILYYHVSTPDGADDDELLQAVAEALGPSPLDRKGKSMSKRKPVVLVVDDDVEYQEAVRLILEKGGYVVLNAYSRDEGLEKARREHPNLIVLDIMMDKMTDGFHTCYELKRDPKLKNVPVLAISAIEEKTGMKFSPVEDQEYFPADDYLVKPVKAEKLLARVAKLLSGGANA